jgi:hypothetical protein
MEWKQSLVDITGLLFFMHPVTPKACDIKPNKSAYTSRYVIKCIFNLHKIVFFIVRDFGREALTGVLNLIQ